MKLYSRFQLILFSLISMVAVLFIAWIVGFLTFPSQSTPAITENEELQQPQSNRSMEVRPVQFNESVTYENDYLSEDELENINIYKRLNEAVVNITSISMAYRWFYDPVQQEDTGSGFIIDHEGRVLTNYHVIKGARKLLITLADGTEYEGTVIGSDPENDLSVIQFDPKGKRLTIIPFGSSSNLHVGQKVLAIGNPFALERTLTTGIVSGLGRPVKTGEGLIVKETIQTDASINPGNSGGPLLNSRGEMIGINTAILSPSGGSVGVGFAVPVDTAKRVIPELIRYGEVRRGWIDIVPVQLFPQLVSYAGLPVEKGILVSEVKPGGLAEAAGIRGGDKAVRTSSQNIIYIGGDILIEVDDLTVASIVDLYSALEDNKPGETVDVVVIRGKSKKSFQVTLSNRIH
jgi:S1-C subfamily serine protease